MHDKKNTVCCRRIPEGTSHYLRGLLLGLLKKNPKERISHGVCVYRDGITDSVHIVPFLCFRLQMSFSPTRFSEALPLH